MPPRTAPAKSKSTVEKNGKAGPPKKKSPDVTAYVFGYDDPVTVEKAKTLLGWEEEVNNNFGGDFLLTDLRGVRIRCTNNVTNRPFYMSLSLMYAKEMLEGKWKLNGEPVTIDDNTQIISGQHRLIAVVLADQMRVMDLTEGLVPFKWDGGVTFPTVLVAGIDSSDETVNTVDCGKKRSTGDALYRTEMFASLPKKDRKPVALMAGRALRVMWDRAGVNKDYTPLRSHTESIAFVTRHQSLVKACNHVYTEDGSKRLSSLVNTGVAAGLLYLFGVSASDPETYHGEAPLTEDNLDLSLWGEAEKFFSLIAQSGGSSMNHLRKAMLAAVEDSFAGKCNWEAEASNLLCKAWNVYRSGKPVTEFTLKKCDSLEVGGIDMGRPETTEEVENGEESV